MTLEDTPPGGPPEVDAAARPEWLHTGYKFFPYAAIHDDRWWILRLNYGFPEHDLYTLFINGKYVADITGDRASKIPLVASIGSLQAEVPEMSEAALDSVTASTVVGTVAQYVNYGSERGEPCIFCSEDHDGMTLG